MVYILSPLSVPLLDGLEGPLAALPFLEIAAALGAGGFVFCGVVLGLF